MANLLRDCMTPSPVSVPSTATASEAAARMRDRDIGDVIVVDNGSIVGIVTDRDITVRVVANGKDPHQTPVAQICTEPVITVLADDKAETAVDLMRKYAVRRLPVVDDDGKPVGIVSLGDLAIERGERSALAGISAAPPNR